MPPPGKRQVNFTPVETVLCYGLFLSDDPVVDPHRYGAQTIYTAPQLVHDLAALFKRRPSSITSKMMNLNGSRVNGAKYEVEFFMNMGADFVRSLDLYGTALRAAAALGHRGQTQPHAPPTPPLGNSTRHLHSTHLQPPIELAIVPSGCAQASRLTQESITISARPCGTPCCCRPESSNLGARTSDGTVSTYIGTRCTDRPCGEVDG